MITGGRKAAIAAVVVILVILAIWLPRNWLAHRTWKIEGEALAARLSPKLEAKYGEELKYTLDKFWSCYSDKIISRNDMTDVMDRLRKLKGKSEVEDKDIFEFIGYVSRIYTDAIQENNRRRFEG